MDAYQFLLSLPDGGTKFLLVQAEGDEIDQLDALLADGPRVSENCLALAVFRGCESVGTWVTESFELIEAVELIEDIAGATISVESSEAEDLEDEEPEEDDEDSEESDEIAEKLAKGLIALGFKKHLVAQVVTKLEPKFQDKDMAGLIRLGIQELTS